MECARLDRVILIRSAQPPHRAAATAPAEDRLAMTNLAMQREPRFEVSDVEVTRGGRSYTADTLAELARRSEEHTSELQSHLNLVCRLLLEKKKKYFSQHVYPG